LPSSTSASTILRASFAVVAIGFSQKSGFSCRRHHDQSGASIVRRRDNDGVYANLLDQGLLILEEDDIRTTVSGQLLGSRVVQVCLVPMPPVPITPTEISSE
jgi:hypothetical protein